jgi:Holliday junction resolvase
VIKQQIKVKKASGKYEPFSTNKVKSSLQRAGADDKLINQIIIQLQKHLYDGISTKEIYQEVYRLLNELKHPLSLKYNLKQAIMDLGPSGYPFEKFVAGILASHNYQIEINQPVSGKCINHEVDIVAKKQNQVWMIECKFHNKPGTRSEIKEALYTYARFLDINQAGRVNQGWLITNTKVTKKVIKYANCVNLKILSWDYPVDKNLRFLIDKSGLHPITCLNSLTNQEKQQILNNGIVFSHDLLMKNAEDKLSSSLLKKAKKEIKLFLKAS